MESCDTLKTSRAKQNTQLNTKSLINIGRGEKENDREKDANTYTPKRKKEKRNTERERERKPELYAYIFELSFIQKKKKQTIPSHCLVHRHNKVLSDFVIFHHLTDMYNLKPNE